MLVSSSNKFWYWVVGITTVIVILVGVLLWQNNQSTVIEETNSISPSPTTVRHDNSGAGATQENPLQEHFDRAMQHLGI